MSNPVYKYWDNAQQKVHIEVLDTYSIHFEIILKPYQYKAFILFVSYYMQTKEIIQTQKK